MKYDSQIWPNLVEGDNIQIFLPEGNLGGLPASWVSGKGWGTLSNADGPTLLDEGPIEDIGKL